MAYPTNPIDKTIRTYHVGSVHEEEDQSFIAHYEEIPLASAANKYHAAITLGAAAQDITSNITNPDVARQILITKSAATIDDDVVITGTDIAGNTIIDTIDMAGAGSTKVSHYAFKTITNIHVPIQTNVGTDTLTFGSNEVLGLPYMFDHNTIVKVVTATNGNEATYVLTMDDSVLAENMLSITGYSCAGTKVHVYFMV